jgi:hypothetical protein
VVVEDHRRRHGRQQPPHGGWPPRLLVQPGVLLEVDDLVADVLVVRGSSVVVVQALQPSSECRRRVVGVHLVADQQ